MKPSPDLGLAAIVLVVGCAPQPTTVSFHMADHYGRSAEIHTALISGDLDRVNERAEWLSQHAASPSLSPDGYRFLTEMKGNATIVRRATTLVDAAAAAGRMAGACGGCHESLDVDLGLVVGEAPVPSDDLGSRMAGHIWAADQLWDGLIGPSPEAWRTGAETLLASTLYPSDIEARTTDPAAARELATGVYDLARRAVSASSRNEMTAAYGDIVSQCSLCHGLVGVTLP